MTDRELLELAAKAAGPLQGRHRAPIGEPAILCANDLYWCPLQDDGDALRLAVKLHINIEHLRTLRGNRFDEISAYPSGRGDCLAVIQTSTDPYAATRLAIVSAAAEIGKSMETQDD